jgi:hypothetical protein
MTINQTYKTFNIIIITVIVFAIMYVLTVNLSGIHLICQINKNNIQCENCGLTRGLFEFFHLNFYEAYRYNPKSIFMGCIIFFQLIFRILGIYKLNTSIINIKMVPVIVIELFVLIILMLGYRLL